MNPIVSEWYADPEVRIFGGRAWMYPTRSLDFHEQLNLDAFSSPDLVNWTKHEAILDASSVGWLRKCLWAPVVFTYQERYYMVFSANDIQVPESPWWKPDCANEPQDGGLGLAVADRPEGPFRDAIGKPLVGEVINGAQPIDACTFEHEGRIWLAYGGWGHCNLVKLSEDLTALDTFGDGELCREITPSKDYVEGPFFFKRGDWWYFLWSEGSWSHDDYRVAYARSRDILGPWENGGRILESDPAIATGAGHCAVLQHPDGADFLFYHRRPIPNQSPNHRVCCIEKLIFDAHGNILPVQLTNEGIQQPVPVST